MKLHVSKAPESSDEGYSDQRKIEIPSSMENWSEEQRAEFAYSLLLSVSTSTLSSVTQRLTPLLHRDFLNELPDEIALQILSYTNLDSLVKASEVSHRWKLLCSDQTVWKKLFCKSGWNYNRKLIRSYLEPDNLRPMSPYLNSPGFYSRPQPLNVFSESEDAMLPDSEGSDSNSYSPSQRPAQSAPSSAGSHLNPQNSGSSTSDEPNSQLGVFFASSPRLNSHNSSLFPHVSPVAFNPALSPLRSSGIQSLPLSRQASYSENSSSQSSGRYLYPPSARPPPSIPNSPMTSQFRPALIPGSNRASPRRRELVIRQPNSSNGHFSPLASMASPRGEIMNLAELFNDVHLNAPNSPGMASDISSPALIMTPLTHSLEIPDHDEQSNEPLPGVGEFYPGDYFHPRFNPLVHQCALGKPAINWKHLYRQRRQLERNWETGSYTLRLIPAHSEGIYCIQFDELKIVSGSRDDTVKVWDIKTNRCLRTYRGHRGSVLCLQYKDNLLVTGSSDSSIIMWDLSTGKILRHLVDHADSVLSLRFDDQHIVSCSKDRTVKIWDTRNGKLLRTLTGHRVAVNAVQFVNNRIVSASGDRTIKLWDLNSGECLRTFQGHARGIACLAFDGKYIVSGSSDKTIKVWDADSGTCLRTLSGHTELVRTLELGPGGRVISGSYDNTLKVWDLRTGRLVLDLDKGHHSRVFKLQFSDTRIVSCSQDQSILLWDFAHNIDTTFLV